MIRWWETGHRTQNPLRFRPCDDGQKPLVAGLSFDPYAGLGLLRPLLLLEARAVADGEKYVRDFTLATAAVISEVLAIRRIPLDCCDLHSYKATPGREAWQANVEKARQDHELTDRGMKFLQATGIHVNDEGEVYCPRGKE